MKTPEAVATAWYLKAKNENDDFDRFVYLWFAFNVLYSNYFKTSEKWAIEDFINKNWRNVSNLNDILGSDESVFFHHRIHATTLVNRNEVMRSKEYYNKIISLEKLREYQYDYLPDDYGTPRYVFYFSDIDPNQIRGIGSYYIEVFFNGDNRITSISRYRDDTYISREQKVMCRSAEEEAEYLLHYLTSEA
jgi:hypothetical protein